MKKLFITLVITAFTVSLINAQFTGIGGGLAFSSGFKFHNMDYESNKSGHPGAFITGIYVISSQLHVSPSYTILIPHTTKSESGKIVVTSMMFDLNGHYIFRSSDRFDFYALAGIDILLGWKKEKYADSDTFRESDNAIGLNIGAGSCIKLTEQFHVFGEIKYLLSKYDQIVLNAGILIRPDWLIKNGKGGE